MDLHPILERLQALEARSAATRRAPGDRAAETPAPAFAAQGRLPLQDLAVRVADFGALDAPLGYLGLHPLVGDALVTLCRGADRPGEFVTVHGLTNSHSPNGELGLLAVPTHIDVAWLGPERITVEAGTFDAQHYALRWQPHWPPADIWVHGPQALFLRLTWSLIDARYELAELRPGA